MRLKFIKPSVLITKKIVALFYLFATSQNSFLLSIHVSLNLNSYQNVNIRFGIMSRNDVGTHRRRHRFPRVRKFNLQSAANLPNLPQFYTP